MSDLEKKAVFVGRLISAVNEYENAFRSPMPMKVLSGRFGKPLRALGGFVETIEELRSDGTLVVGITPTGAKYVGTPGTKATPGIVWLG